MESVTLKKEINWEELLGANPILKNRKEIVFFNHLDKQIFLTRIIKIKISDQEYIMSCYDSEEVEEIQVKNKMSLVLLEVKYYKKKNDLKKKVNYNFAEVICYFLVEYFKDRLENDKEFQAIKKFLEKYEEISLEISENSI